MLKLQILNASHQVLKEATGDVRVWMLYDAEYAPGDTLVLTGTPGTHIALSLDDAVAPACVYMSGSELRFPIPDESEKAAYSPRAFALGRHCLWAELAGPEVTGSRRNLALNPWDRHDNHGLYPHATANVETRNEAAFAARNAIDGLCASEGHGSWPYASWGINRDPDAALRLEFGRPVVLDEVILVLRADFPHDAWWEQATLLFSDDSRLKLRLEKSREGQSLCFEPKTVEWLELRELIKAEDPSPFPALRQILAMGRDLE